MYDNFELCLHQVRVILTNVAEYGKASYVIHQNPLKDKGLTSDKEWFSTKAHWECIAKGHLSKYILKKQRDYYVLTPEGQKLYNKLGPVDLKDPDTYKKTYFFTKGKSLQYQIDQIKECFKLAEAYIQNNINMEVLIREFRYSLSVIKFILTSIKKYKDVDIKEKLNELYSSNKITEEEMESTNKLLENINFELLSKYIKKNEYEDLELTEKGNNLYNILGSANLDEPAIYKNIHNFVNDKNDKNKKLIEEKVLTFFQLTECIIYNYIFYKFA